jgi:predicted KAP-like P-loop ATPase
MGVTTNLTEVSVNPAWWRDKRDDLVQQQSLMKLSGKLDRWQQQLEQR